MTTKLELLETIRNGENSHVEFKRDDVENYDLAKELVAFSNLEGGMVLLGVEDGGSISGLSRSTSLEEWVMTLCRDKIRPSIIPSFEIVRDLEPGMDVAIVRVQRGSDVHGQWHHNKHTYYIRVGTQSREATPQELSRLFQQRGVLRVDLRPIPGVTINDLDRRRLVDYFVRVRQQETPDDDAGWRTLLVNTEIMVEEGVTLSGILLFGRTPNKFLPQAGISATAFPGTDKDYTTKERKVLRGPMTPLIDSSGNVLESGLVEQALEFVKRNTSGITSLEDGVRRVEKPAYPDEVIREAVVNALIHRDYLLGGTDVELSVYKDRLEIVSPGKLPNGITPEKMRVGARSSRNPMLTDVMRDYGYLEHLGMGVPKKIIPGMKKHNGSDTDLIEEHEQFSVRLFM